MKLKAHKKKAMTLIEILISLALIAILLVPIANVVISTSNTSKRAEAKQQGSLIGKNILEQIKAIDTVSSSGEYQLLDNDNDSTNNPTIKFIDGLNEMTPFTVDDTKNKNYSVKLTTEILNKYSYDENLPGNLNVESYTGAPWNETSIKGVFANAFAFVESNNSSKTIELNDVLNKKIGELPNTDNLILEVGPNMECQFFENTASVGAKPNKGSKASGLIAGIASKDRIMIHLKQGFTRKLNIAVIGNCDKDFSVEITRESNVEGDVTVVSSDVKCKYNTKNYAAPNKGTQLGDLYKVTVEVIYGKGSDAESVFTATTTNNITFK